tara:strand:- start:188 stop:502 length:315 start_codon:yes stop_codon:yes gene_type:complete
MAVYSWLSIESSDSLISFCEARFAQIGLDIVYDFSTPKQVYAISAPSKDRKSPLVKVILSRICKDKSKLHIEVRSSESMLKSFTKCEKFAKLLEEFVPPSQEDY